MNTDTLLKLVIDTSEEFKALDLKVLKVDNLCDFADYFVIMSGGSTTQVKAICEELYARCKQGGRQALSMDGLAAAEWCLLDFGDIVVHIFLPEKRTYYALEELWSEAEITYTGGEQLYEGGEQL